MHLESSDIDFPKIFLFDSMYYPLRIFSENFEEPCEIHHYMYLKLTVFLKLCFLNQCQ